MKKVIYIYYLLSDYLLWEHVTTNWKQIRPIKSAEQLYLAMPMVLKRR